MLYDVVRQVRTTHGGCVLIGYLIRDVSTGQEHLAIFRHGKLMGYIPLDDIIPHNSCSNFWNFKKMKEGEDFEKVCNPCRRAQR